MFFDSHAHYDDERFDLDRDDLLKKINQSVDYVINCGADLKSSRESINLANKFDFIFAAVGVHPENVKDIKQKDLDELEFLVKKNKKVKAIGEIGLDFYQKGFSRDEQIYFFKKQLEIANKLNLPVIIHSRDANQDTFEIIKSYAKTNGVIHCYSGDVKMALDYINLGFFIGIGGIITFKNAKKMLDVVKNISIENILLETDCPYLSPEPNRGKRNDSSNLIYVAQKIAEIKNISLNEVAEKTKLNAKKLFNIN
ncbi:MAG: TatD family hydrolase [Firmicutes bacterium]|nr:TatD family hydrolase [Bacillota bacterium]